MSDLIKKLDELIELCIVELSNLSDHTSPEADSITGKIVSLTKVRSEAIEKESVYLKVENEHSEATAKQELEETKTKYSHSEKLRELGATEAKNDLEERKIDLDESKHEDDRDIELRKINIDEKKNLIAEKDLAIKEKAIDVAAARDAAMDKHNTVMDYAKMALEGARIGVDVTSKNFRVNRVIRFSETGTIGDSTLKNVVSDCIKL